MSPSYWNNQEERDNLISIWEIAWRRMKIMIKIKDVDQLEDIAIGITKLSKISSKDIWRSMEIWIIYRGPKWKHV